MLRRMVYVSVWLSVTLVLPAKGFTGWNVILFGRDTCMVPSNIVLDRGPGPPWEGEIWRLEPSQYLHCGQMITNSEWLLYTACENSAMPYSVAIDVKDMF